MRAHLTPHQYELAHFQLRIAEQWFERGEKTRDVFAKFFFFYTAFNALFFLWKEVDEVGRGESNEPRETKQIENLLGRLGGALWDELGATLGEPISFFAGRAIERMDKRGGTQPLRGKATEGRKHQRVLADPRVDATEKLKALGNILYLVRCNLAHGSKMVMGDDFDVIENAVPLLQSFSSRAIQYTKGTFGGT